MQINCWQITPFSDYLFLREYLIDGGTIEHALKIVDQVSRDSLASGLSDPVTLAHVSDEAAILRYGMSAIDYHSLDAQLEVIRDECHSKYTSALQTCSRVKDWANSVVGAFAQLERSCVYDQTSKLLLNRTGIPRFRFGGAFRWLTQLQELLEVREDESDFRATSQRCLAIAQLLNKNLLEASVRAHSMIERTYKDVPVVQELNSYKVAAGKFADYLQALKEIGEVPLKGVDEATEELASWCNYLDGYHARFKAILDRAYEGYIPCLIARASFWDEHVLPKLESA
ncbi:hypothetical protein [Xanthomonas euvesicatoria]|uniref:hypothetical protein n=1 Tax=Xanthomonas euvesicatoria TaxID=456327 RepID=UPI00059BFF08|nr:hypothetical protein [Xanthomonas euvesicatoria]PPU86501.1 hypothetical protein XaclCFBP3371_21250 [Xanthomonas euvesicatoria pv. citrumelonis]TKA17522.1 hypothetical protein TN51_09685 [Xanthomonas euvesicatoria pv. citrumelonis]